MCTRPTVKVRAAKIYLDLNSIMLVFIYYLFVYLDYQTFLMLYILLPAASILMSLVLFTVRFMSFLVRTPVLCDFMKELTEGKLVLVPTTLDEFHGRVSRYCH